MGDFTLKGDRLILLVYVINKHGKPLMPCKPCKARKLLKDKKAKVVGNCPFTIQLLYGSSGYKQKLNLGVDAGAKTIGLSVTAKEKVLYECEYKLRDDVSKLLNTRKEARRTRRNRKTRYREPRFNNRVHSKYKGWLAPSIEQRIQTHLSAISDIYKILPIYKVIVETASFDIQRINNPEIIGTGYQQGEQLGFWNTREYVLFRDKHVCQCCKGKSKDNVLNVHHIESRKTGGNAPNNLVTLCKSCHTKYHKGELELPKTIKRGLNFKDVAFMGIMRWTFYNRLRGMYPRVEMTYGYITKNTRINNNLPKAHYIDARCISGNPKAVSEGVLYLKQKVRRHNRKLYKDKTLKGNKRKKNQCPYEVKGFRRFDIVEYGGTSWYINSLRQMGNFVIKDLESMESKEVKSKSLRLLRKRGGYIIKSIKIA